MNGIGNTRLVSIVSRTPNGDTQIRVGWTAILVIRSLNGGGIVSAGNLQHANASFNPTYDKIATKFSVLLLMGMV